MAWPTPALDDLILSHDTGGKRWLHALCQALNERQGCLGLTKTQFVFGDGSEASDPAVGDFTDLWIGGERDGAITNLNRCMAGLKAMLTHTPSPFGPFASFKETSGSSGADWTLASLQTDIGLGGFGALADGWTDLNFWKQMKESFDRLIYVQRIFTKNSVSAATNLEGAGWPPAGAGSSSPSGYPFEGEATWHDNGSGYGYVRDNVTGTFNLVGINGTLTESYYRIVRTAFITADRTNFEVGDVSFSTSDTTGDYSTSDILLNSNNSIFYEFVDTTPNYPGSGGWQGVSLYYAKLYYDIAAELTDQA